MESIRKQRTNCGRRRVDREQINEVLRNSPLRNRKTIRDAAAVTGFVPSTLWNVLKRGDICRVSNTVKPLLTEENKPVTTFPT